MAETFLRSVSQHYLSGALFFFFLADVQWPWGRPVVCQNRAVGPGTSVVLKGAAAGGGLLLLVVLRAYPGTGCVTR